jgi:hypothetical protein
MIKAESGKEGKEPCPSLKDAGKRIKDERGRTVFRDRGS